MPSTEIEEFPYLLLIIGFKISLGMVDYVLDGISIGAWMPEIDLSRYTPEDLAEIEYQQFRRDVAELTGKTVIKAKDIPHLARSIMELIKGCKKDYNTERWIEALASKPEKSHRERMVLRWLMRIDSALKTLDELKL